MIALQKHNSAQASFCFKTSTVYKRWRESLNSVCNISGILAPPNVASYSLLPLIGDSQLVIVSIDC